MSFVHGQSSEMSEKIFCDVCQQELTDGSLKNHMEVHFRNQDKNYECNVCDKIFYQENGLSSHSRMHKENKKQCKVCLKSFRWANCVRNHLHVVT